MALAAALLAGGCWPASHGAREPAGGTARQLRAERVLVLADGQIVIGGVSERGRGGEGVGGCDGELEVVRLDTRGKLDAGFGDGGRARVGQDGEDCVTSVDELVHGPDGQTLAGATVFHPSDTVMDDNSSQTGVLTRLTSTGRVDEGFEVELSGFRFAVAPDGSIFDELGTRYLPDGDRGPRAGKARVRVAVDLAVDVDAPPDGSHLFLGLQDRTNYRRLAVQRFDADWQPDETFGENGMVTADIAPGKRLDSHQPELQRVLSVPGGAVIAFGLAFGPQRSYAFAIKFDAAGRVDRSFGDRGRVEIGPSSSSKEVYDLAVQPDGRLIAIGSSGSDRARRWFVARYDANGAPDRRFGRNGRVILDPMRAPRNVDPRRLNRGNSDGAITAGRDGTIVGVASLTGLNGGIIRSLAFRLRPSGKLDPSFGRRGVKRVQRLG